MPSQHLVGDRRPRIPTRKLQGGYSFAFNDIVVPCPYMTRSGKRRLKAGLVVQRVYLTPQEKALVVPSR